MEMCTPEKMGIHSENILKYVKELENSRLATHDILIMREDKIIYEAYWKPFSKEFKHRMYSVTKSFVAIAIGFLEQEGKVSLDDKISKYYAEELKNQPDENMHNQTIRHMLMMSTAKPAQNWFDAKPKDRVSYYFQNDSNETRPSGTLFQYDSSGSFVLGALVEKISGMSLVDYLRSRLFDKIGVSEDAYLLKCPGGYSWGDSALICTPRDLLLVAKFMMNRGMWNGKQILNEKFVTDATSCQITNNNSNDNEFDSQGYGYLIWRTFDDSFFFYGMGCQFAVCVPDKDLILIYNADNQGKNYADKIVIERFFDLISRSASDKELPENPNAVKELAEYSSKLKLLTTYGEKYSPIIEKINNKIYLINENNMGISKIKFSFDGNIGVFNYTNEQGNKKIPFKMNENEFVKFPQDGYSDGIGSVPGKRHYDCAVSASWVEENHLLVKVQVIDTYFGVLDMHFSFQDRCVGIQMIKAAEDFFNEYQGFASGEML